MVAVGAAEDRSELAGVVGEGEAARCREATTREPREARRDVTTMSETTIEATEIETAPTEPPRAPPAPAALALHVEPEAEPAPVSPMLDPTDPRWALALQPQSGRAAFALAARLAATRYFGGKSPEDIAAIILMGRERGVSAMLALSSMHVIDGKVEMSATLIAALILRSNKARVFRCVETTDTHATYEAQRVGDPSPLRVSFSAEDAKRRGLWGKGNWAKMPDVMLAHRACTKAARLVFPDVVVGLYGDDEIAEARAS